MIASRLRISLPTAKPFRYQATCLRKSMTPRASSPIHSPSSVACRTMMSATSRNDGFSTSCRRPSKAATRSAKSHGRPRHPRPTTTPSHPVSRTIRTASSADQMSPLPSTGISGTCSLSRAIASQSAVPP